MIITKGREHLTNKWCMTCRHHSSYHQLITRDKWAEIGGLVTLGRIPWFCEYTIADDEEGERLCACTDFQPTEEGGIL